MMNLNKHAFLVMAHSNKEQLLMLLKKIDNPLNDIYLHIDRKVDLVNDSEINSCIKKSKVFILRDVKVTWGAFSQVECELCLLKKAIKEKYSYYHLLSGADCIICSMDEFHKFFDRNYGKEFIHFQGEQVDEQTIDHIRYYYPLQEYSHYFRFEFFNMCIRGIQRVLLNIQKLLHINRYRNTFVLQKGANWFSITDDFARYVISQEKWIRKKFMYSLSSDELFLQSVLINSRFKDTLYKPLFNDDYCQCARLIDWKRGKPYVFTVNDYKEVVSSGMMIARKCDISLLNKL